MDTLGKVRKDFYDSQGRTLHCAAWYLTLSTQYNKFVPKSYPMVRKIHMDKRRLWGAASAQQ